MYILRTYFPGDPRPRHTLTLERSADVLEAIPRLLQDHAGCERVEVYVGTSRLFSVDSQGQSRAG